MTSVSIALWYSSWTTKTRQPQKQLFVGESSWFSFFRGCTVILNHVTVVLKLPLTCLLQMAHLQVTITWNFPWFLVEVVMLSLVFVMCSERTFFLPPFCVILWFVECWERTPYWFYWPHIYHVRSLAHYVTNLSCRLSMWDLD